MTATSFLMAGIRSFPGRAGVIRGPVARVLFLSANYLLVSATPGMVPGRGGFPCEIHRKSAQRDGAGVAAGLRTRPRPGDLIAPAASTRGLVDRGAREFTGPRFGCRPDRIPQLAGRRAR